MVQLVMCPGTFWKNEAPYMVKMWPVNMNVFALFIEHN